MDFKNWIVDVPDFPKPGIIFKDISPLLASSKAYAAALLQMSEPFKNTGITHVLGAEARGFLLAPGVALDLGAGFVPVRKPGKLPRAVHAQSYDLEYGQDHLEIHADALPAGSKVLLVDDVLATGGTMEAIVKLCSKFEVEVIGASFLMELSFLNGRDKLNGLQVHALLKY